MMNKNKRIIGLTLAATLAGTGLMGGFALAEDNTPATTTSSAIKVVEDKDAIFHTPNIDKFFDGEYSYVTNGYIYYKHPVTKKLYMPKTRINKYINVQTYNITKALLENNERGNYVETYYRNADGYGNTVIWLKNSIDAPFSQWRFGFWENKLGEEKEKMYLQLDNMYDNTGKNKGKDWRYDDYYRVKLQKSLAGVFGANSKAIADYIALEYKNVLRLADTKNSGYSSGKCAYRHEKKIGNITVISTLSTDCIQTFSFRF